MGDFKFGQEFVYLIYNWFTLNKLLLLM